MRSELIMAALDQVKEQLANCQCAVAKLEILINEESPVESPTEIPVIEEEVETLPEPPKEIHVDLPKEVDEEVVVGCQILNKIVSVVGDFYDGVCDCLRLQKVYYDNTGKIDKKGKAVDRLFISPSKVRVTALNIEGNAIGEVIIHQDNLVAWQAFLSKRKLYSHKTDKDPHKNWWPYIVNLELR